MRLPHIYQPYLSAYLYHTIQVLPSSLLPALEPPSGTSFLDFVNLTLRYLGLPLHLQPLFQLNPEYPPPTLEKKLEKSWKKAFQPAIEEVEKRLKALAKSHKSRGQTKSPCGHHGWRKPHEQGFSAEAGQFGPAVPPGSGFACKQADS